MRTPDSGRDKAKLEHVLDAVLGVERLLASDIPSEFLERTLERYFEIIGEACKGVSAQTQARYPMIPWKNIIALRNFISHEYEKVEMKTLRDIAEHKIPALKDWILGILRDIEQPQQG